MIQSKNKNYSFVIEEINFSFPSFLKEREFSKFLIANVPDTDFVSKIKVMYRPYICPFDEILQKVGNRKSIFDIGCGSGMFLSLCAEYIKPKKLAGIEIKDNLINNSKKLLSKYNIPIYLKVFDGKSIPQKISDYDVITMIDVLHHIPIDEQISFLKKVIKKMKKGSNLIIKDINKDNKLVFFNKLHDLIFSKQIGNEIGFVKLKSILEEESVKIISCFEKTVFVYPHYFISLRKK